jgi:hypothetical protein
MLGGAQATLFLKGIKVKPIVLTAGERPQLLEQQILDRGEENRMLFMRDIMLSGVDRFLQDGDFSPLDHTEYMSHEDDLQTDSTGWIYAAISSLDEVKAALELKLHGGE